jgi:hypothetical protein
MPTRRFGGDRPPFLLTAHWDCTRLPTTFPRPQWPNHNVGSIPNQSPVFLCLVWLLTPFTTQSAMPLWSSSSVGNAVSQTPTAPRDVTVGHSILFERRLVRSGFNRASGAVAPTTVTTRDQTTRRGGKFGFGYPETVTVTYSMVQTYPVGPHYPAIVERGLQIERAGFSGSTSMVQGRIEDEGIVDTLGTTQCSMVQQ